MPYVGIMGGTFDPIHFGHLVAAQGAMHLCGLDKVIFIPNREPPHKPGRPISHVEHRAAMVRLAIAGNPCFEFSDLELKRKGPSYTIDTIQAIQSANPGWRTAFLIGMDSLIDISTWHEYRTVLSLTDLIVVGRPGYLAKQREIVLKGLGPELTKRIRVVETPGMAVSASELRRLSAAGYPLGYLVPDAVAGYIAEHQVYRGKLAGPGSSVDFGPEAGPV